MSERGFIAVARGILDHPVVGAGKSFSDLEAWLWLLFEAGWKPRRVRVTNGRAVGVLTLQRGQLSYSRSYLMEAWGWTEKSVRGFLFRLERDGQIALQTGHLQTVITICNYDLYQNPLSPKDQQTDRQWAGKGPEEEQREQYKKDIPASSSVSKYAFEAGIIRLTKKDYEQWRTAFSHLDLTAELIALRPWAEEQGQGRWFHAVANALAKRNRETKIAIERRKDDAAFKWNGIEGVI